jgi:signal transduction histidine kinase
VTETQEESAPAACPTFDSAAAIRQAGAALKTRITCFGVVFALLLGVIITTVVVAQHDGAVQRARSDAANLSAAFQEQVRRVMDNVSGAMDILARRIAVDGTDFDLADWMQQQIPEISASTVHISIVGPDGRLINSSLDRYPDPIDVSDREHFSVQRDNPNAGLFIGKPMRGRLSKVVAIQVTKRLDKPDGSFAGIIAFSLDPDFLTGLHDKVDLGNAGVITLMGSQDAVIRARYTSTDDLSSPQIGKAVPDSGAIAGLKTRLSGEYTQPSKVDGVTRIFYWRAVPGFPLIVMVGLGLEETLAAATRHGALIITVGVAALALLLVTALLLHREIDRRVEHEIALCAEGEKLRAANLRLTDQHRELLAASAALASQQQMLQEVNTALELSKHQAEEASRAKSSFLANMSHELRTPLNAIIGFSEIIRDRLFGNALERYADCAGDIRTSGVYLLGIINDMLDLAKVEAGKFDLHETVVPLSQLVASCLPSVTPQAASNQVSLITSIADDDTALRCDEMRFRQILINLLSNAVKFTPAGGSVTLTCAPDEDGSLRLCVTDTGIGMTPAEITSAMELFRQVDNQLARRYQGTGLGLPIAVQLAQLHGASIHLASTPGLGTTATVRVPASRVVHLQSARSAADGVQQSADRRRAPRESVAHAVFAQAGQQRASIRALDISDTGMRIERFGTLKQGDQVRVDWGTRSAEGTVVWQDQRQIGLQFMHHDKGAGAPLSPPVPAAADDGMGIAPSPAERRPQPAPGALPAPVTAPAGHELRTGLDLAPGSPASAA